LGGWVVFNVIGAGRGKPGVYPLSPGILIKIKIEKKREIYTMLRGILTTVSVSRLYGVGW
jgi:hypothetical protein